MDEKLHQDPRSPFSISEPELEKLEGLEERHPQGAAPVNSIPVETTTVPIPEQYPPGYDPYLDNPTESVASLTGNEEKLVIEKQSSRDWWRVGAVGVLIIATLTVVGGVFLAKSTSVEIAVKITETYEFCEQRGGETSLDANLLNRCIIDGKAYFANARNGVFDNTSGIEDNQAKNGQIVFSTTALQSWDRSVTSNNSGVGNLPIATYTLSTGELQRRVVVNHAQLAADSQFNNDFNVQKVYNFLDNGSEFQKIELLGDESLVLRAFQNSTPAAQSKTLGELMIKSKFFEKGRSVWGLDGDADSKFIVKSRFFGKIRNNVVMVEASLPQSAQQKLSTEVLTPCIQKFKSASEIQTCFITEVQNRFEVKAEAETVLQSALKDSGLE